MINSKLQKLIERPELILKLQFSDISEILNNARDILREEYLLMNLELKSSEEKVYVIGDLHGNLQTLKKILEIINKNNPRYILFLGDLVDRGENQLECLISVLILKIISPTKYFILKGNHETFEMNQAYGFYSDFLKRFKDPTRFNEILSVYQVLPICFVFNNSILCVHGGIPEDYEILNKLNGIKTKQIDEKINKSIGYGIFQILWNDPKDVDDMKFSNSFRGAGIKFFGQKAFDHFMEINGLKYLIRGHECFLEGYRWFFNRRLLSIFSAANYRGYFSPNPASYAIIRNNLIFPKIIEKL